MMEIIEDQTDFLKKFFYKGYYITFSSLLNGKLYILRLPFNKFEDKSFISTKQMKFIKYIIENCNKRNFISITEINLRNLTVTNNIGIDFYCEELNKIFYDNIVDHLNFFKFINKISDDNGINIKKWRKFKKEVI